MDLVNTQDKANDITFYIFFLRIFFFAAKLVLWTFKTQQLKT